MAPFPREIHSFATGLSLARALLSSLGMKPYARSEVPADEAAYDGLATSETRLIVGRRVAAPAVLEDEELRHRAMLPPPSAEALDVRIPGPAKTMRFVRQYGELAWMWQQVLAPQRPVAPPAPSPAPETAVATGVREVEIAGQVSARPGVESTQPRRRVAKRKLRVA